MQTSCINIVGLASSLYLSALGAGIGRDCSYLAEQVAVSSVLSLKHVRFDGAMQRQLTCAHR